MDDLEVDETQVNDTPEGEVNPSEENNQNPTPELNLAGWTAGATAEQKEKFGSIMAGHDKFPGFLDAAFTAMDKVSRAIVKPGDDASEDEITAYREALGMPVDSNSYELNAEGSGTESFLESLKGMAFENNLSQTQAQSMVDCFMNMEQEAKEKMETERKVFLENSEKELIKELGSNYQPKMLKVQRMIKNQFGDEFFNYLDDTQMGSDPRFIRPMMAMAELISEDDLDNPPGGGGGSGNDDGFSFPNTPDME